MYTLRFMEQNKCLHNSVKIMKLTFLALCIFALQINENLASVIIDCSQGQKCNVYGRDYGECGNGYCLNRPDDPNLTCYCPYENFADAPVVCEQGKTCYGLGQDYEGCGNGYCLNLPDDPKKTCHCPYVPPTPKPAICKQGQQCEQYVIQQLLYNTYCIRFKNSFS